MQVNLIAGELAEVPVHLTICAQSQACGLGQGCVASQLGCRGTLLQYGVVVYDRGIWTARFAICEAGCVASRLGCGGTQTAAHLEYMHSIV